MDAAPSALPEIAIAPAPALAAMVAGLRLEDVPEQVRLRARLSILDALGCGIASNAYPFAARSIAGIVRLADGPGKCSVVGRGERLPVRDAALANGILIHGLDFDDTHLGSITHSAATSLPCALSLGEALDVDGATFLAACMAGMEASIRVGWSVKGGFHHVGFHATGVVAHFSSALVAGKLLGLSENQLVAAQGIAASTASGVQVFLEEGSWTKRLHPGWAAVAGITAARLAEAGFVGPSRPYEGKFGLYETHLQGHAAHVDMGVMVDGLGARWHLADSAIKPYPVCHFIHGCADAAVDLSASVDWREIAAVEALLPKDTMPIVAEPVAAKQNPTTDYEAKFSAPFVIATCLIKGGFGLPELTDAALSDPDVQGLTRRVTCAVDGASAFPKYFSGGVKVTLKDGTELFRHGRVNSGAGERALDTDGVSAKFMRSASMVMDETKAARVRDVVLDIENRTVAELGDALRVER
ncbi:MAG: MmgE/PrpD family protein [Alphaproteobacteria bacterium]